MDSLKQTQSFAEETFEEGDIINDNVEFLEKEDEEISGNKTPPHHQSSSSASAAPPSAPKKAKKTQNPKGKQPVKNRGSSLKRMKEIMMTLTRPHWVSKIIISIMCFLCLYSQIVYEQKIRTILFLFPGKAPEKR